MDPYVASGQVQRIEKPGSKQPTMVVGFLEASGGGLAWEGTASLIYPRFVLTAAHCLVGATAGSVSFGYDRDLATSAATKFALAGGCIPAAYKDQNNDPWDIGVAELAHEYMGASYCLQLPAPPQPRQMGFWVGLTSTNVLIYGYPGTRRGVTPSDFQKIQVGHAYVVGGKPHGSDVSINRLNYEFDTRAGQSGAPVLGSNLQTIVAIHSGWDVVEAKQMGVGVLMTPAVTEWINKAVKALSLPGNRPFVVQL